MGVGDERFLKSNSLQTSYNDVEMDDEGFDPTGTSFEVIGGDKST